jgi:hypothetical protein
MRKKPIKERLIMKRINWETIGNFAKDACTVASYVLMLAASCKVADYITDDYEHVYASYDDAVSVIMRSGMYSHDKVSAAATLKRGEDAEYYKAIIHVAQDSRLYSHDKVKLISNLSGK